MKNKYIFGGIIIAVFLSLMAFLFTQTSVAYEENFVHIMNSNKTVKASGTWVKEKSFQINKEKKLFSFYLQDPSGTQMKVVYKGTIPNNFESSTNVVVTGKYHNGNFIATDILTKCPSKYEGQDYEKHLEKNT